MPRFCRYCGNQLSDTAKFCKGCGNAVHQGSAAVPQPAPEAQNATVCPSCGAGIRPGVKFCRNCGQTVAPQPMASAAPQNMTAQYQQRINNSKAQTTEKKKEPSKLPIVLIAVVCVIIMAVGIFAIGRTVLPGLLSSDGSVAESGEGKAFTRGNSKAFSEEIVDGVTISAEKNALDKNRKFTMEEVSAEKYEELADSYQKKYDEPGLLYDVWELDAGLKDDEVLPGTYRIDMDLDKLGIDKSMQEDAKLYRIDDEGNWYEYSTELDGSTLTCDSNQNSLVAVLLGVGAVAIPSFAGYQDLSKKSEGGAYMKVRGVNKYILKVDNKDRFQIIIDTEAVRKTIFESTDVYNDAFDRAKKEAFKQAVNNSSLPEDCKKYGLYNFKQNNSSSYSEKEINEYFDAYLSENGSEIAKLHEDMTKYINSAFQKELEKEPEYKKYLRSMEDLTSDKLFLEDLRENMQQVDKICKHLDTAWFFLKDQAKTDMPTYVMDVHLSDKRDAGEDGHVTVQFYGNPYMVLFLDRVANGDDKDYDEILLTITHELFHAVQRLYLSQLRCNYGYDETLAQVVEYDAYNYFYDKGVITTTDHLENMKDITVFAIPLDKYYAAYQEEKKVEIGTKDSNQINNVAYQRAPFVIHLRGDDEGVPDYGEMMRKYKGIWSKNPALTTILKRVFSMDDKKLEKEFFDFADNKKDAFYNEVKSGYGYYSTAFSPFLNLKKGSGEVKLVNRDYTIRVRRIKCEKNKESDREYALILKENEDFKKTMSDFKIVPLKMEEGKDYCTYKDGLFIYPRAYPEKIPSSFMGAFLMEVDGGSADSTEGWVYDDYSGYRMCVLNPIEAKTTLNGSTVTVEPLKLNKEKKDFVDSIVVKAVLGKETILFEQIKYEGWNEPVTLDLKKGGEPLDEDELSEVKITVHECVSGTYSKDGEGTLLGPAADTANGMSITGTWEFDSVTDYSSAIMNSAMDAMQGAIPYTGDALKEFYDAYGSSIRGQTGYQAKGKMTIEPGNSDGKYVVKIKFDNTGQGDGYDPPVEIYDASYDAKTGEMLAKPRKRTVAGSRGESYDLSQYGLQADLNISISSSKDEKSGKEKLVFNGKSANDQNNNIAAFRIEMNGSKIKDEVEELK